MGIAWRDEYDLFFWKKSGLTLRRLCSRALALTSHYAEEEGVGSMGLAPSTTKERSLVTGVRLQRMPTCQRSEG